MLRVEVVIRENHWCVALRGVSESLYFRCETEDEARAKAAILTGMLRDAEI